MKPLLIILKTLVIGCLWSIIFIDAIRVVLLINWHFDICLREHWRLLGQKWNSGTPISKSELAFFSIIVCIIPVWTAGWLGLCAVKWGKLFKKMFMWPVYLYRKLTLKRKAPVVIKKKSIAEEVKPIKKDNIIKKTAIKKVPIPSATLMQSNINSPSNTKSAYPPASKKNPETPADHALFNFDDDDFDLDFDFDKPSKNIDDDSIPSALVVDKKAVAEESKMNERIASNTERGNTTKEKSTKQKTSTKEPIPAKESHTPVLDVLKQKGYDVIPSAVIKNITIDYIAVSKRDLILCLIDKEVGDWLADEEKFNDEEPLWFSESSHRISPVRQIDIARDVLKTKLTIAELNFKISPCVVVQSGNIINAEDMFEVWNEMDIKVTRINRGSPKELQLFSKSLDNCEENVDKTTLEKLKKLIRSMT